MIRQERDENSQFGEAYELFKRSTQNYLYSVQGKGAIASLIVQYYLVRQLSNKIFKRASFITSASVSADIEKVLAKSTVMRTPPDLIRELEPIIRHVASFITNNDEKLLFLETILLKFFPEKDKKGALLHSRVFSKMIFSRFLADSIELLLQKEFNTSMADEGLYIINPFVDGGYYIRQLLENIDRKRLESNYVNDIYGNELRMIPYFLSLINIESKYIELKGDYTSFTGLSMVDTLALSGERSLSLYSDANSQTIERQSKIPFSVIIGETPIGSSDIYSKKSRGYPHLDKRVFMTYTTASTARNKAVVSETYVKTIRWASDKIAENKKGIVALVCRNSFIDDLALDGLRKYLVKDFDSVYVLDIYKKEISGRFQYYSGDRAVLFLIKNHKSSKKGVFHYRMDWDTFHTSVFQSDQIDFFKHFKWREIKPDKHFTWLTEGLQKDYELLVPMGTKISKAGKEDAIFRIYGRGIATSRDAWIYNFRREYLAGNVQEIILAYNKHVQTWSQIASKPDINEYLGNEVTLIPWSDSLKNYLQRQISIRFKSSNIRDALYRPFVHKYLYFDQHLIERWYQIPQMLPTTMSERENRLICVSSPGSKHISFFISNMIPDLNLFAGASPIQCFPLYHYDKDGHNRRENISDWALQKFIHHYEDERITKYDIFHYVYAVLHHPSYIRKYAANLRKQLPRIPFTDNFQETADAGKNLARLHLFCDGQVEYPLRKIITFTEQPDWHIEKIVLSKNQRSIKINDYLSISNIPAAAFDYVIGNRSALEWVIEQYRYRESIKDSIIDDPNKPSDPTHIIRLIGQVITVSLETMKIVNSIPSIKEIEN
jgi:predicted helicase